MTKEEERKKIVEAIASDNFIESCEKMGFNTCTTAEETKGKKKANI